MCDAPSYDNSAQVSQQEREAEEARKREEERQARLTAGTESIRKAFSGFDDGYYGRFREAFIGANQPALGRQQETDVRNQFFNLARAGNQRGSSANEQRARLAEALALQQGQLIAAADDAVTDRRGRIADTKMSLETQLRATEDADLAASNATSQARALDRTPSMTTGQWLTPLVAAGAGGLGAYQSGESAGYYREMGRRMFPMAGGSASSAGVVR